MTTDADIPWIYGLTAEGWVRFADSLSKERREMAVHLISVLDRIKQCSTTELLDALALGAPHESRPAMSKVETVLNKMMARGWVTMVNPLGKGHCGRHGRMWFWHGERVSLPPREESLARLLSLERGLRG